MASLGGRLLHFAKTKPMLFGAGYSLAKTMGADLMVQKVLEKREEIDWKRNIAFGTFGLFYLGGVQYVLYVPIMGRLFPGAASFAGKTIAQKLKDAPGIRGLFAQVFLDQMVHHPLLYFPVFYCIKDFVTSESPDPVRAVSVYRENMAEDLIALWKVWLPSTFINFAFMPMWGRIPWVATTSLVWTCILSAMRGGDEVPAPAMVGNGIDARTMELFTRTVIGPAPRLDPDRSHLLVIAHGPDQPGIIAALARKLYDQGATITTSKMMSLGADFSIMMHVDVDPKDLAAVKKNLAGLPEGKAWDGVFVSAHEVINHEDGLFMPAYTGQVRLTGIDKPGLLFHLADVLSAHKLNIEHLQTEQHMRKGSEPQLFTTHCVVSGAELPDLPSLKKALKKLENELGIICTVEPKKRRLSSIKSMTR